MKICTYTTFSVIMALVILIPPYIMTVFGFFNKDKTSTWRRFFIIVSACYLPLVAVLAGTYVYNPMILNLTDPLLKILFLGYYLIYLVSGILIKKRINLQLNLRTFFILSIVYYLMASLLLSIILFSCDDPLSKIFATRIGVPTY